MKPEAAGFIEKAARSLGAAALLLNAGHADFAASRAYYTMLYVADALLAQQGERFREHAASHAAFEERFVRIGLIAHHFSTILVQSYETRLTADYSVAEPFPHQEAAQMIEEAREFLEMGRTFLTDGA